MSVTVIKQPFAVLASPELHNPPNIVRYKDRTHVNPVSLFNCGMDAQSTFVSVGCLWMKVILKPQRNESVKGNLMTL